MRAEPETAAAVSPAGHEARADPGAAARLHARERRVLIVSAPFGHFARVLADRFRAQGADVRRVLLNAGDSWYWRGAGAVPFRGRPEAWPEFLRHQAADATDILIFGEAGPYNSAALALALEPWQRLWVLENGYFRPDWITLEQGGTNASTRLPRSREPYEAAPGADLRVAMPDPEPMGRTTPHHVMQISWHHLIQLPGRLAYPHYAPAYLVPAWLQCAGHIRRYFDLALRGGQDTDAEHLQRKGPFFLVCLQREGDTQLLRYSRFADNTAFMSEIFKNFAREAPPPCRLVIKNHPLDPGVINLRRICRNLALDLGLADRVDFIDGGNLAQLSRASLGMVVNNSSAALSALGFGTPVKALGRAFFDMPGLTDPQPLADFWKAPRPPEPDLFEMFRRYVIDQTQINGNFHAPWAREVTAARVADRILGPTAPP